MHHEWNIYFRMKMKFDIFATLDCVSRPCFDFSVIFFTPSSTLDSVIGSYVSITIIVFNVIDFNLWRFSVSIVSMWVHFQTSWVSFVLLALGLCFFWIAWVQDDAVQKIFFMIFTFYICISQKWLFIMLLTIGGASRKRGAGSSSTHEDLKLGEKPAGGIAYLKSVFF